MERFPEPRDVQVVVLMGGLGTRLGIASKECPKSMTDVNGSPFFDYQLQILKAYGFCKFLFLVGYRADMIEKYYKDGSSQGITIKYSYDGEQLLGTGGAVRKAYGLLEDDFILIYGDSFMDINYNETIYRYFRGKEEGCKGLMTVLENKEGLDKSNVFFENGRILLYDKCCPDARMKYVDYGIGMYEKELFLSIPEGETFDISNLQKRLSVERRLAAHEVTHRFFEIGTPESLREFRQYARKRFRHPGKAIFFDRDGVINEIVYREETEKLDSPVSIEEVVLIKDTAESMKKLQQRGYYLFIVTNQPAAAKGSADLRKIYDVNTHICKMLKKQGVSVEAVEICPHHPVGSAKSKDAFLIRKCICRKPETGMIEAICKRFRIDRNNSWMIGDSYTDVLAGKRAELRTAFLGSYKCDVCKCLSYEKPDLICETLQDFILYTEE